MYYFSEMKEIFDELTWKIRFCFQPMNSFSIRRRVDQLLIRIVWIHFSNHCQLPLCRPHHERTWVCSNIPWFFGQGFRMDWKPILRIQVLMGLQTRPTSMTFEMLMPYFWIIEISEKTNNLPQHTIMPLQKPPKRISFWIVLLSSGITEQKVFILRNFLQIYISFRLDIFLDFWFRSLSSVINLIAFVFFHSQCSES